MYKIKNSKNTVIVTGNGKTVIPVNNILFATSLPFTVEEKELDVCYVFLKSSLATVE